MKRLIGLFLVGSALLFGQGQQTIYQQLFSASNPANGTVSSVVVNNGQAQHMVNYYVYNQPAKTCTYLTGLRIEGSFDAVHYVPISPISYSNISSSVTTPYTNSVFGYGIYPYVRVKIITHDVNNCLVSVWYGGTVFPASTNDVSYAWLGFLTASQAIVASNLSGVIAVEPSGGATVALGRITLYGLDVDVPTGATLVSLQCRAADLTTVLYTVTSFNTTGPSKLSWPASKQARAQCPANAAMMLTTSGTGTIVVGSLYRFE